MFLHTFTHLETIKQYQYTEKFSMVIKPTEKILYYIILYPKQIWVWKKVILLLYYPTSEARKHYTVIEQINK